MALKALICPNCGARITTFDESTKKGFCPYCDALITDVPDLQVRYEVTGKVAVDGISTSDDLAQKAETFRKLDLPQKAIETYHELTDDDPADWRGWYGLFELADGDALGDQAMDYYDKFFTVADEQTRAQKGADLAQRIDQVISSCDRQIDVLEQKADQKDEDARAALDAPGPKLHNIPGWVALVAFILFNVACVEKSYGWGALLLLILLPSAWIAFAQTKSNNATREALPALNKQRSQQLCDQAASLRSEADSLRSKENALQNAKLRYCS